MSTLRTVRNGQLEGRWAPDYFTCMQDCELPVTFGCHDGYPRSTDSMHKMCTHHVDVGGFMLHASCNSDRILGVWSDDGHAVQGPFGTWGEAFAVIQDKYDEFVAVTEEEVAMAAQRTAELLARLELK